MRDIDDLPLTSNHCGTYRVETEGGRVKAFHDFAEDDDPSPIGHGIVDVLEGPTRITAPMARKSWLEGGPGTATDRRGGEPFVQVSWDQAEMLVADELNRVRTTFGNEAIYADSNGWASAGRFHHAQSQIHRFLNCIGGYTRSVNTYSFAAVEVVVPHILGDYRAFVYPGTSWRSIIDHTELFVAFGGVPLKNGQIAQGGCGRHRQRRAVEEAVAAGVRFVNISPLRSDVLEEVEAEWLAPRPSTDTAILLAFAHTLLTESLHDEGFLDRCTVGFDRFAAYLRGETNGIEKSADWAAAISMLDAETIRDLARRMAGSRTMLSVSWSLTRQDHGEQPFWAAITLASMLGQIGLPGGGFGLGYSAVNSVGNDITVVPGAALPQGRNPVDAFTPVARISNMLLNPGTSFDYNGKAYSYPDIRLVYRASGNPFHHHQDLNRMLHAWQKPETVIAHEWCWNGLAKHADIVLPCTTPLERTDLAFTPRDGFMVSMERVINPVGESRDDYGILRGIARKMGVEETYTEGREPEDWIEWIYNLTYQRSAEAGIDLPTLSELQEKRWFKVKPPEEPAVMMKDFRGDPNAYPLKTPSGKIEIFSETIASFRYNDCPPHAAWMEPIEWLGSAMPAYPLHLISNQPASKLHSQLDHGSHSRASKLKGREPVRLHPKDAESRGITDGDPVRAYNARGACFGTAVVDDGVREGVIQISTGAWFDPVEPASPGSPCKHGNPNMLTMDKGTSRLGPIALEIERATESPSKVTAFAPPEIIDGRSRSGE